jgi:long-chain fatty acid transport protein
MRSAESNVIRSRQYSKGHYRTVRIATFSVAALVAVFCGVSAPVQAQGFGVYEQGACAMGRAGAGVASPCDDGSGLFFNPAGLAIDGTPVVSATITGIAPRGTFTNSSTNLVSTLNDRTIPVPAGYVATPIGKSAMFGLGVFAPYGLVSDWPATAEGRYLGYYSSIKSIYVQPTLSFSLSDQVRVGVGIDITHTSIELQKRVDLSTLPISGTALTFGAIGVPRGTDFADVNLTGSGNKVGAHLGVIIKATDRFSIGARYLMKQSVSISNGQIATQQINTGLTLRVPLGATLPAGTPIDAIVKSAFASGGLLSNQTATTSIPLPGQFVLGVALQPTKHLKLLADYQLTQWSAFDQIVIVNQYAPTTTLVESYNDTNGVRLGAEYSVGRGVVRLGFDGHGAGAPDQTVTPVLPEASRKEFTVGAGLPLGAKMRFDVAYMYINQADRAGRSTDGGLAAPTAAVNNGTYHYNANLFSAGFVVHF